MVDCSILWHQIYTWGWYFASMRCLRWLGDTYLSYCSYSSFNYPRDCLSEEHGTDHSEISTENGAIHQQEKVQVVRARYEQLRERRQQTFAHFLYAFFVWFLKTTEYDQVNTRSNVAADPICRFHLINVNALHAMDKKILWWTRTYSMILYFSWVQRWCFVLGVNSDNTMAPEWYESNFQNIAF